MVERQHKVLGQNGSKLVSTATESSYGGENVVQRIATSVLIGSPSNLQITRTAIKISDELDFGPDRTIHFGVTHP